MLKKCALPFALYASLLHQPAAHADQALANTKGCMACHDTKTQKIGPSYRDIAKKYAGQTNASSQLAKKILEGSSGVWGVVAMPANKTVGVTAADAQKLVTWILTQQ